MSNNDKFYKLIKENNVQFVDFRFTDPNGKWQHTSQHISTISDESLEEGFFFDGSSIMGWKSINESDMILMPDLSTAVMDPFTAQSSIIVICNVIEPSTGQNYTRDPRSAAIRAEKYLQASGIGDTIYFGPEAEFFVFDDVRFDVTMNRTFYEVDSEEGPYVSGKLLNTGNLGHRPGVKGGYFPVAPIDSGQDLRAEMITVLLEMGIEVEKHHHEVAPSQHELGIKYAPLVRSADNMQIYKHVVHMVANSYGKTATFMPKPIAGDNGSGMHLHQSIWKDKEALFAGVQYADLSETALHYIGGIIKHAKAINAFTNPTTNSYKRLVPGFEAPVLLAYSSRNRSAACRIPYTAQSNAKRVEVRFPDPSANPYLSFAALLMAGLDGIENRIDPGEAMDKNLYDLPPEELKDVPTVCGSLREALHALNEDREFLKKGDVFTDDLIDAYLDLKWKDVYAYDHAPHPIEYKMYYSV